MEPRTGLSKDPAQREDSYESLPVDIRKSSPILQELTFNRGGAVARWRGGEKPAALNVEDFTCLPYGTSGGVGFGSFCPILQQLMLSISVFSVVYPN
jgi:hypothetical protein